MGAAIGYAGSLARNNKLNEAEEILHRAQELPGAGHLLYFKLGNIQRAKGDYEAAKQYYLRAYEEAVADKKLVTVGASFRKEILAAVAELYVSNAYQTENEYNRNSLFLNAAEAFLAAYNEKRDSFLLYKIADIYLKMGEKEKAAEFFRKFINRRGDDYYRQAAEKLLLKIGRDEG